MSAKLESLIVDLQLQYAELRKGVDQANAKLTDFGKGVEGIAKKLDALGAFEIGKGLVKGLAEFAVHGAEAADHMGKLAQAASIPVEAMSHLAYAANLSNVAADDLGKAMSHLNTQLAAAGRGSKDQVALFGALGVSVRDAGGHLRSTDQIMSALADRFAAMSDGPAKAALAIEVFGKAGAQMLPMLNEGGAGLKAMADEADRLGLTIDSRTAAAAERFNDNLTRMKSAVQAVQVRVAADLTPALTRLTDELLHSQEGADTMKDAALGLATALKVLASGAVLIATTFEVVGKMIGRVASIIADAVQGNFAEALAGTLTLNQDILKDTLDDTDKARGRLKMIWDGMATDVEDSGKRSSAAMQRSSDSVLANLERQKAALAQAEKDAKKAADTTELGKAYQNLMKTANAAGPRRISDLGRSGGEGTVANAKTRGDALWEEIAEPVEDFASKLKTMFADSLSDMGNALKFGGNMLVSKLGELGTVIQAGIQGAQQGGLWGALFAVILEMLSRFKRWSEIIDIGNGQLEQFLADCKEGLGSLVDGIKEIMGGIGMIAKAVHGILNPIFKFIGELLGKFSSVFAFIGQIIEPIGTVLESLFSALSPILDILDMLSPILTVFAIILLSVLRAFFTVTNAITDLLDALSLGIFHQWIQKLKINTDKLDQQISTLSEKGLSKLATESADASGKIGKMADAANEAARSLTNLPTGFKVNLEEYMATLAGFHGSWDPERSNFLATGNPTTTDGGHDSGGQGGSKGNTGGSHHGDA